MTPPATAEGRAPTPSREATAEEAECLRSYLGDTEAAPPSSFGCGCVPFLLAAEEIPHQAAVPAQQPSAALTVT